MKLLNQKISQIIFFSVVVILIPIVLADYKFLFTWQVITLFVLLVLLMIGSPKISSITEAKNEIRTDRFSVHVISVLVLGSYIVPIIDSITIKSRLPNLQSTTTYVGLVLMFGGMMARNYSVKYLGKFFAATVTIRNDHRLISGGPYKYIRHPSYISAFVSLLGISIFLQSMWGIAFCVFLYFPFYFYRISIEEKALAETFGADYESYKKKTWAMIPYIY